MILDSDLLYEGPIYRTTTYVGGTEEEYLKLLQPKESMLRSQRSHDRVLDYFLDSEEDLLVMKTVLGSD
ncbi:MAG: hypothetical protein ABEJ69_02070 [Candidatus Nanohaloarchaea archaeon]